MVVARELPEDSSVASKIHGGDDLIFFIDLEHLVKSRLQLGRCADVLNFLIAQVPVINVGWEFDIAGVGA